MLSAMIQRALRGGDLPEDLPEQDEAIAMIVTAARDLLQARRARDASTAIGDMKAARQWGAELAVAEDTVETQLRTLGAEVVARPRHRL